MDLKYRLRDVETDYRNRLHGSLLGIVGALTAPEEPSTASRAVMFISPTRCLATVPSIWSWFQGSCRTSRITGTNRTSPAFCADWRAPFGGCSTPRRS